jgi:hypothetical protein
VPRHFGEPLEASSQAFYHWLKGTPWNKPMAEAPPQSASPPVELALMRLSDVRTVMQLRSFAKGQGDGGEALNREESMQDLRVSGRRYHAERRRQQKQAKQLGKE